MYNFLYIFLDHSRKEIKCLKTHLISCHTSRSNLYFEIDHPNYCDENDNPQFSEESANPQISEENSNQHFVLQTSNSQLQHSIVSPNTSPIKQETLAESLQKWAVKEKITHNLLSALLPILKPFHPELPLCAKILLIFRWKICLLWIEG
jgi:hypothetical protein